MEEATREAIERFVMNWNSMFRDFPLSKVRGLKLANALLMPVSPDLVRGDAPDKDDEQFALIDVYNRVTHTSGTTNVLPMAHPIINPLLEVKVLQASEDEPDTYLVQDPFSIKLRANAWDDDARPEHEVTARIIHRVTGYKFGGYDKARQAAQLLRKYFESLPDE